MTQFLLALSLSFLSVSVLAQSEGPFSITQLSVSDYFKDGRVLYTADPVYAGDLALGEPWIYQVAYDDKMKCHWLDGEFICSSEAVSCAYVLVTDVEVQSENGESVHIPVIEEISEDLRFCSGDTEKDVEAILNPQLIEE
jgi:hypothetical protein